MEKEKFNLSEEQRELCRSKFLNTVEELLKQTEGAPAKERLAGIREWIKTHPSEAEVLIRLSALLDNLREDLKELIDDE